VVARCENIDTDELLGCEGSSEREIESLEKCARSWVKELTRNLLETTSNTRTGWEITPKLKIPSLGPVSLYASKSGTSYCIGAIESELH
jgi:hypothetical protein